MRADAHNYTDPGKQGIDALSHSNAVRRRTLHVLTFKLPGESDRDVSNIAEHFNEDMRTLITRAVRHQRKNRGKA